MDQLIQRLKGGFQSIKGIQAFLVFGSHANNCADEFSDLDFLIIAKEKAVPKLIQDLKWLDKIEPIEISFREGSDNFKALFRNGIIGDFGIVTLKHYQEYPHEKGKVIFQDETLDLESKNYQILPEAKIDEYWLNQFLFTSYISLGRSLRGESVCATKMMVGDVLNAFLHLMKPKDKDYNAFQIDRHYESLGLSSDFDLKEILLNTHQTHVAIELMLLNLSRIYDLNPLFMSVINNRIYECHTKFDGH